MPKRQRIKRGKSSVYVKRNKKGQFIDIENIGRATLRDSKTKAKTKVKSGYGWRGDLK